MTVVIRFQPGLKPMIQKHAMHDQSTHGSWAKGPNRLYTTEILRLHKKTDSQVSKVYKAEQKDFDERTNSSLVEPKFDNNPSSYSDREAYKKAYKEYSKSWDDWALSRHTDVRSSRGEKLLNGTKKGVEKYVGEVLNSTWFLENFGDGGPIGQPKITTTTQKGVAGKWQIGYKLSPRTGETYMNQIALKKRYMKNEPTILHEISHFATAISETNPFESHGKEFAGNHIRIVTEFLGPQEGASLRESYTQGGVEFD